MLEQEKVVSLQEILKSKDNLLTDIKKQYQEISDAKIERYVKYQINIFILYQCNCCCSSMAEIQTKLLQEQEKVKQMELLLQGLY